MVFPSLQPLPICIQDDPGGEDGGLGEPEGEPEGEPKSEPEGKHVEEGVTHPGPLGRWF